MKIREVFYSSHFLRALKKLSPIFKKEIVERGKIFQNNCFDERLRTHKLKGKLRAYWSFSLTYSHRVLFAFRDKDTVEFIDVDDHNIYHE